MSWQVHDQIPLCYLVEAGSKLVAERFEAAICLTPWSAYIRLV